jgi:hypothetical protein
MHQQSSAFETAQGPGWTPVLPFRLGSGSDPEDGGGQPAPLPRATAGRDDLPYIVELWDDAKTTVEQVLAVTAHGSIGYAAYYAATREYPDRYITLRHRNRTVARSNTPDH